MFLKRRNLIIILILIVSCFETNHCLGQHILDSHPLPAIVPESSGLIYLNGKLVTFNDSGGENKLYEIDPQNGNLLKEVVLKGVHNVDWEDICQGEEFIYVADIGNNSGSRKDLKIYIVRKDDYLNSTGMVEIADSITYSYKDQTSFEPKFTETRYDAEALISYQDHLYLFTKNWLSRWTNIYQIPKTPGDYDLNKLDSIAIPGVITGGCYNASSNEIVLTGYNKDSVFLTQIKNFTKTNFSKGVVQNFLLDLPETASHQVEGISALDAHHYYITTEGMETGSEMLYKLNLGLFVWNEQFNWHSSIFFDKFSEKIISESHSLNTSLWLYNISGQKCKYSSNGQMDIQDLQNGIYLAVLIDNSSKLQEVKKLIIQR